uniref:Small ribosomal subunit protein uS9c n=1 Tax=Pseudobryopsis hainanensis TaxID=2320808 RepID=A0A3S7SZW9_9CHLO|nr:ribosomal protein S9 [Pseudobryopsis hainanensis]
MSWWGIGRRKTAVARVQLAPGGGRVVLNGCELIVPEQNSMNPPGLNNPTFQALGDKKVEKTEWIIAQLKKPLLTLGLEYTYDLVLEVHGGGISSQLEACQLAIARALCTLDLGFRSSLKRRGFLRRDARVKERRKYGLKKARKAPQFSKR